MTHPLLAALLARGVLVSVRAGELVLRGNVTDDVRAEVNSVKDELLASLGVRHADTPAPPSPAPAPATTPVGPCHYCGRPATFLCDFPVGKDRTCDRPICADHRTKVASGIACSRGRGKSGHKGCCQPFTIDHCREHGEPTPPPAPVAYRKIEVGLSWEICPLCNRALDLERCCRSCGYRSCAKCHAGTGSENAPLCVACDPSVLVCVQCKRPTDERGRCWKCGTRRCSRCGRDTGSAFISTCVRCGLQEPD